MLNSWPKNQANKQKSKNTLLIYNSWATFHQANKNFRTAIKYLLYAQNVYNELAGVKDIKALRLLSKTKLNLSSIYTSLGRYADARDMAE